MPFTDEDYLRNYLNDEIAAGDSYDTYTDTYNITTTVNTVTLTYSPSIWAPLSVVKNSITLNPSTYSVSGNIVNFVVALVNTDVVQVTYQA